MGCRPRRRRPSDEVVARGELPRRSRMTPSRCVVGVRSGRRPGSCSEIVVARQRLELRRASGRTQTAAARCRVRSVLAGTGAPWAVAAMRPSRCGQLHHVLRPPSGLTADAPANTAIDSDQRAQQRHFLGGEVAPVIAALDRRRGVMKLRLRSSLIDHAGQVVGRPAAIARTPSTTPPATSAGEVPRNRAPVSLSEPNDSVFRSLAL